MNAGGVSTKRSLIIGAELFGRTPESPLDELNPWERSVVQSVDRIPQAVAHEIIHSQQLYAKEAVNLLERSMAEGSADFLSKLIAGAHIHQPQRQYGDQHEVALWKDFRTAMDGKDFSGWLYNGAILAAKGDPIERPADLGYFVGYKICQAYYEKSADKKKAIKDILEIRDFDQFFRESGYGQTVAAGE